MHRSPRGRLTGKVLLIGVGIDITPVRALLETAPAAPGGLTLLYRARSEPDLVLRPEIEHIAAARNARVYYLLGRRGTSEHLSPGQLRRLVPDLADHEVYLCGPDDLVARLARDLRRLGVDRRAIHFESFSL